jgi:salicylate hydroxylase
MAAKRILIAGAGLGGLSAAACLIRKGHHVTVFEQAPQLGEIGAGIQISANAGRVLDFISIGDKVAQAGVMPAEYRFRTYDTGEVLQTIRFGKRYWDNYGVPYVVIHRADLHALLADSVRELDPGAILTGHRVTGFSEEDSGVTVHLQDREPVRGDLVVGGDGIRSMVREKILGASEPDYTGDSVWRVLLPMEQLPEEFRTDCVEIFVGPGKHAVIYPLRQGKLINLVGCVEQASWDEESWTAKRPWSEMRADFLGWNPMVNTIIETAPRDECYRWVLKNRKPVTNWSSRHATLLGDAAHPTLPYMAQGAAMAIEDGAVLARALEQEAEVPAALQLYQRNRIERTSRVVVESTVNRGLFHLPNMEVLRAEFAKRDFNAERTGWVFSYNPMTVELA